MLRTPQGRKGGSWVESAVASAVPGRMDPGGVAETQTGPISRILRPLSSGQHPRKSGPMATTVATAAYPRRNETLAKIKRLAAHRINLLIGIAIAQICDLACTFSHRQETSILSLEDRKHRSQRYFLPRDPVEGITFGLLETSGETRKPPDVTSMQAVRPSLT